MVFTFLTIFKCAVQYHKLYSHLCKTHLQTISSGISETQHSLNHSLYVLAQALLISSLLFVSINFIILDTSQKWNNTLLFHNWLVSLNIISSGFISVIICGNISFLFKVEIFHCMYMLYFVYPFLCQQILEFFLLLAIMNSAARNMGT